MGQELDSIFITIGAETKDAVTNIKNVTRSLRTLRDTFNKMNTTKGELKGMYSVLKDISALDFSKVEASLGHIATISSTLGKWNGKTLTSLLNSDNRIISASNPEGGDPRQLSEINAKTDALAQTNEVIRENIKVTKEATKAEKENTDAVSKGTSSLSKLLASIKRIAIYRAIRRAIQIITNAFKEGVQAVSQFDEATNKAMSSMVSSWKTLKTALGSLSAPIVQALSPILTQVINKIVEATNKLAELFAFMNGQETFSKAKDQVVDYAETLKKATSTGLGIDELNVVKQDEDVDKYEEVVVNIKGSLGEILMALKKSLGLLIKNIGELVKKLLPLIEKIIEELMPVIVAVFDIVNALMPAINTIVDVVTNLLDAILKPIANLLLSLKEPLEKIAETINRILNALRPIFELVGKIIAYIVERLTVVLEPILKIVVSVFEAVAGVLEILQPIFELLNYVWDTLASINGGADYLLVVLNAVGAVVKWIGGLFEGVAFLVLGVATLASYVIETVVNIGKTIKDIFTMNWGNIGNDWGYDFSNGLASKWDSYRNSLSNSISIVPQFAVGGFPEDGFFYANHNELVGSFANGQTAVANNEQIIEGIKQGVMEAMEQSGGANVTVYLDSREISAKVEERINNKGATIIKGGTLSYGK